MTLGEKIKKYRTRSKLSQLDLELEINTSPGRISKIENGKINPDKETIIAISKALELKTPEIASLFGIELLNVKSLFNELNKILLSNEVKEIIDISVNDLIFKMGYIASAIFLLEDEKIYMRGLTISELSKKALDCLDQPLDKLYIPFEENPENLTVKSINDNIPYTTDYTHEYITPLVSKVIADKIQNVAGDKSNIIFPLAINNTKIGAIVYVKKIYSSFSKEKELLEIVSNLIAIALYKAAARNK
jgi:transcriptional regulator with XRE-family HTH domain